MSELEPEGIDAWIESLKIKPPLPTPEELKQSAIEGSSFSDLIACQIPEVEWVSEKILAAGFTILAASIELGKSALTEWLASDVGKREKVCYFALEYSERVTVKRFKKFESDPPKHLQIWHQYDIADSGQQPYQFIRDRISEHKPYLVVLDTLELAKPRASSKDYSAQYATTMMIKVLADEFGTSIVANHHARKKDKDFDSDPREMLLGSQGIGAAADNILVYDRPDGRTRIQGFGRTIEDFTTYLRFDDGFFTRLDGDQVEMEVLREKSPLYAKVLWQLQQGPLTYSEICGRINSGVDPKDDFFVPKPRISEALKKAKEDGYVHQEPRKGGLYSYIGPAGAIDRL